MYSGLRIRATQKGTPILLACHTGDHVYFVDVGHGYQHPGLIRTGLFQYGRAGPIAAEGHDIETFAYFTQEPQHRCR